MDYQLWHGDCLEEMDRIEDGSVDMICADLPYGTTACKWDVVIPFEPLWKHYKRVIKKRGAVVLFGCEPFSSFLRLSNLEWYKYDWIWDKVSKTDAMNAPNRPMRQHENISIFSSGTTANKSLRKMSYFPQGLQVGTRKKTQDKSSLSYIGNYMGKTRPSHVEHYQCKQANYPGTIIQFSNANRQDILHPTQKPVALLSYLIKTYTNEGDTILDNTCGSGSTLEAAMRCNRHSIGIEKDAHYYQVASDRLARVAAELRGELNHLPMFAEAVAI